MIRLPCSQLLWVALLWVPAAPEDANAQCGRQKVRGGRIVGGQDSYDGEFPWVVSLKLRGGHYCGGTIVDKRWVVTAAHCVHRHPIKHFQVRVGEYDLSDSEDNHTPVDILVEKIERHPNFSKPRKYNNDIALVQLKEDIVYSNYVQPVCLPDNRTDLSAGLNATVVGWGWLDEMDNGGVRAERLQKARVPIVENSQCQKWYAEARHPIRIRETQLCAGYKEGKRDSCQGDSGGPLVVRTEGGFTLIGVVSAGIGCGRKLLPGLYTRVPKYLEWMEQVMEGN